jgi:hypothetical protein
MSSSPARGVKPLSASLLGAFVRWMGTTLSAEMSTAWRLLPSSPHSRHFSRPETTTFWPFVRLLASHSPRPPQTETSKYEARSAQLPLASL